MSHSKRGTKLFLLFVLSLCIVCVRCQDAFSNTELVDPNYEYTKILESLAYVTCNMIDKHWKILRWYFSRVPIIEVTDFAPNKRDVTRFSQQIVKALTSNSTTIIRVYRHIVPELNSENITSKADGFPVRQILNFQDPKGLDKHRPDESLFGSLIYTDDLNGLRRVIEGPLLNTFSDPNGNFFIVLSSTKLDANWQDVAAFVLEQLWWKLSILYAVIIATCDPKQQIGFYVPFELDETTMRYGVVKWSNMNSKEFNKYWVLKNTNNWQKYPVITAMFRRYPTLLSASEVKKRALRSYFLSVSQYAANYTGFDGVILGNMAKLLNFSVVPLVNADRYGFRLPNGLFNGVLGNLLDSEADIAINSRFVIDYETRDIEFLHQILADQFCVCSPAPLELPQWTAIFRCLAPYSWVLIVCVQVLCGFIWVGFREITVRRGQEKNRITIGFSLSQMYRIFIAYPAKMPVTNVEVLFISSVLLVNIILSGTFRGAFMEALYSTAYEPEINTLQQLDESNFQIATSAVSVKNIFGSGDENDSVLSRSLQSKQIPFKSNRYPLQIVSENRNICSLERFLDVKTLITTDYSKPNGQPMVHVVKQCPRSYLLAYIVKKGHPFLAPFNRLISEFYEAGFLTKWYYNAETALIASQNIKWDVVDEDNHSLGFMDVQTPFYVLVIGLTMSCCVFVAEICIHSKQQKKRSRLLFGREQREVEKPSSIVHRSKLQVF